MSKANEEENSQEVEKNNSNKRNTVHNNELNEYVSLIEKAKEKFKKEIFKIPTKEEKLIYIRHQIQKYSIIKENSRLLSFMSIFVSFIIIISFILFFARTSNTIFFKSLMFTIIVIAGVVWIILLYSMKRNDKKYTIILFALDDIRGKILGSLEGGDNEVSKLNNELKNIVDSIDETRSQIKEGYAIIDQTIKDYFKKNN